ncbi:MAG: hypothetical protein EA412_14745 [Chitinophagaceae bacterium]|nr:MAG: hypothetical protein EA412_14745 [Chitinophagaceae bacterium]
MFIIIIFAIILVSQIRLPKPMFNFLMEPNKRVVFIVLDEKNEQIECSLNIFGKRTNISIIAPDTITLGYDVYTISGETVDHIVATQVEVASSDTTFFIIAEKRGGEIMLEDVIWAMDNYMLKYDGNTLYLSENGGRTYTKSLPIDIGTLKAVHVFKDGEVMFGDHQNMFYSHDWENYYQSTVLDIDGEPFIRTRYDNFTMAGRVNHRVIINGTEVFCWGNYSMTAGTEYVNINAWYTVDKGQTIKSAYAFRSDRDDLESEFLYTRHIHNIDVNPADTTFWMQTGDFTTGGVHQSHVLKGSYDLEEDKWNWELIGSGNNFKWCNVVFYEGYAYWAWDITPGGVVKSAYNSISDIEKHEQIFFAPNDCTEVVISDSGEMVVFITMYGGPESPRKFWYSEDRETFHEIVGWFPDKYDTPNTFYWTVSQITNDGRLICGIWVPDEVSFLDWDFRPGQDVAPLIRAQGFPNALLPQGDE